MSDFDAYTLEDLHRMHNEMVEEHSRLYKRCLAVSTFHPDYLGRRDAMYQVGDHLHAIYAEIKRREAEETADV